MTVSRRYITYRSTEGDGPDDLIDRPDWHQTAACRGMRDWFFTPAARNAQADARKTTAAKKTARIAVCHTCPHRAPCARQALDDGMGAWLSIRAGVWIGDSRARRHLEVIARGGDLYTDAYREAMA